MGKQIWYVLSSEMVNGEEIVWYVDYFMQNIVVWYVYVVVVMWGEVSGYKCIVVEQVCYQIVVCQQGFEVVVVVFGLQDFIFFDFI